MEDRRAISFDEDVLLATKDKQIIPAHGKVTPIIRENRVIGAVCTFRKVSSKGGDEYIRLEFANMASHLLRTPLSFIQVSIDLLMNSDLTPEEQQTTLKRMWEQSRNVTTFTDELLEILRLEADGVQVYIESVSLLPLLERVLELIRYENPNYQFDLVVPDTLPMVAADPAKTELILFNLLTNAVSRCPANEGCVTIELEIGTKEINVSIIDNGEPIPANLLEKVFGQFYPIDDDGKMPSTYQLGLYTTKRLVELQNGRIWANSRPDHESRIGFSLPIWETAQ
jgi:signal transduction histidine kinase